MVLKSYLLVLPALLVGCSQAQHAEKAFAIIDGKPLTVSEVKAAVEIESKILRLSGSPVNDANFPKWANATARRMIDPMINARLLEDAAKTECLVPNSNDAAEVVASYARRTKSSAGTLEELAGMFGELKDAALREFKTSVLLSAYARTHWHDPLPESLYHQYSLQLTNELKMAAQIDALAKKHADEAYARLQGGEKWEIVAQGCSEDKLVSPVNERFAESWTFVGSAALGIKELAEALPSMRVGDYTRPLDTPQGMLIVRLIENKNGLYQLARIMFRMAQPVCVPKDDEELRKTVQRRFLVARQESTLRRLRSNAKIEYPLGTNYTYQIWH